MIRENENRSAVSLICALHKRDGATPIGKLPEPWKRVLDKHWTIWVNGQMITREVAGGFKLEPGGVYVEFNGWPAGSFNMIHAEDAALMAAGDAANYSTFCDALENAQPLVKSESVI